MRKKTIKTTLGAALLALPFLAQAADGAGPATANQVKRGEYLARAGDCIACHTAPKGQPFGGGLEMRTSFGTFYSPNISSDKTHGIGSWSADDFFKMMRTGRRPDGAYLYPVMPFPAYTKVTRADSDAIFAYLLSTKPVARPSRPHDLRAPFNRRELMLGWRTLFFKEGEYQADPSKSAEWNRGAYLVEGLGHCATCHTPMNALGGASTSKPFEGNLIPMQNWYAPSLTSNREAGLGDWSLKDIMDFLQTGVSQRGAVYGPMSEVVKNSLQYMNDEDTRAMAVYLKSLPNEANAKPAPRPNFTAAEQRRAASGEKIYAAQCAVCHGADGRGMPPHFPPLAQNQSIQMSSSVNPIRMVLNGGYPPGTGKNPAPYGMPPFAQMLNDEQVADVVTYIRHAWGNTGTAVTPAQANALRKVPLN